jgi:hypothetical protein
MTSCGQALRAGAAGRPVCIEALILSSRTFVTGRDQPLSEESVAPAPCAERETGMASSGPVAGHRLQAID